MDIKYSRVFLVGVLFSFLACYPQPRAPRIYITQADVDDICIGATQEEVVGALGLPKRKIKLGNKEEWKYYLRSKRTEDLLIVKFGHDGKVVQINYEEEWRYQPPSNMDLKGLLH